MGERVLGNGNHRRYPRADNAGGLVPVSGFVTVTHGKDLALSFLLPIGMTLVTSGAGFHVPKGDMYAAMGFSLMVTPTFSEISDPQTAIAR